MSFSELRCCLSLEAVHVCPYNDYFQFPGEEDIPFLFRRLHRLTAKWEGFCLQLGVEELESIRKNKTSADLHFALALWKWIKGYDNVSWKGLITAVFSQAGGQKPAGKIAESFRGEIAMCSV